MKVLKTIRVPALKGPGKLLPALALTWVFVFLLCLSSYAGDAEDLIDAAWKGNISTVQALLDKGVDVNAKNNYGGTALIWASQGGSLEIVQTLLAKGADVNAKNDTGVTALINASQGGSLEIVQTLLAKGADVNAKSSDDGENALIWASMKGSLGIVQVLLAKGADVNAKNNLGRTALSYARRNGHSEIVQFLINAGAKE